MLKRMEVLFTVVILATLATAALAQGGPTGGRGTPKYDPKTEVTLTDPSKMFNNNLAWVGILVPISCSKPNPKPMKFV